MERIWNRRIKKRRKELGITLLQIAAKLGVSEATAQRYERGLINIPLEYIDKYSEILQCSPSYLMGWSDIIEDIDESEIKKLQDQMRIARELAERGITEDDVPKLMKVYDIIRKD